MTKEKFIGSLAMYRGVLPRQALKTLKGQALADDVPGAQKGLKKLLGRVAMRFRKDE